MIFENILVVTAYMNEGKNLDYPLASKPKVVILKAMRADVTMLITIHQRMPSKALRP